MSKVIGGEVELVRGQGSTVIEVHISATTIGVKAHTIKKPPLNQVEAF